jgi:hypothetical protein
MALSPREAVRPRHAHTRALRRAQTRTRWHWNRSEQVTAALATAALATAGTVIGGQFARMLRRRRSTDGDGLAAAAGQATQDTVAVAVEGYAATPRNETVLFHLLSAFVFSFGFVRLSTYGMRGGWWPLGNVSVQGRHIHHFIPGILLAFSSGAVALLTSNERLERGLAIPFGVGLGLTFDEAALLLDLEDVYWTRQGILSVQISLGVAAMLGGSVLAMRMLQRGEERTEAAGIIPHMAPEA